MYKSSISILAFLFISVFSFGQFHTPVHSNLNGQNLLNNLVSDYKPGTVLSYGQARDTLYANVYEHDDSLTCVYSGHTLYMDPSMDPTQAVYMNGVADGINAEHTYPQSLGASSGNPRSDMHHIYPARIAVNDARATSPFTEIVDSQTEAWYYLNQTQSNQPGQNKDYYSEKKGQTFEPRESHKGNVARAMFYFYTMYKAEADAADPNYFNNQKETLCDWHLLDPVDQLEWERNEIISNYQSGKVNPFILDCTLAERSYCAEYNQVCSPTTSIGNGPNQSSYNLDQNFPNPFSSATTIAYQIEDDFHVKLNIYDLLGNKVLQLVNENQSSGDYAVVLDRSLINAGVYFYQIELSNGNQRVVSTKRLVVQ